MKIKSRMKILGIFIVMVVSLISVLGYTQKYQLTYELGSVNFIANIDPKSYKYEKDSLAIFVDESALMVPDHLMFDGWTSTDDKDEERIYSVVMSENTKVYPQWKSVTYKEEITTEEIKFETQTVEDPELPQGQTRVITQGINGEEQTISKVKYVDGNYFGVVRDKISVTKEKVDELIAIGTKP